MPDFVGVPPGAIWKHIHVTRETEDNSAYAAKVEGFIQELSEDGYSIFECHTNENLGTFVYAYKIPLEILNYTAVATVGFFHDTAGTHELIPVYNPLFGTRVIGYSLVTQRTVGTGAASIAVHSDPVMPPGIALVIPSVDDTKENWRVPFVWAYSGTSDSPAYQTPINKGLHLTIVGPLTVRGHITYQYFKP